MTDSSETDKCPWCGGVTGAAYVSAKEKAATPTDYEREQMDKLRDKPLRQYDRRLLTAMSFGADVLILKSHPWIEGGRTISSYSILKLEAKGLVERSSQHFTEQRFGTRWKLTDAGRTAAETAVPMDTENPDD